MPTAAILRLVRSDAAAGLVLMAAALAALAVANTPAAPLYDAARAMPVTLGIAPLALTESILHWVNDGLMALFFLLVGLEIKHELREGALSGWGRALLPVLAAAGGMIAPALVYAAFNADDAARLHGWAIPAATDIAFALGVLALLGSRAPPALKILLTAIAVIDDLGAILVIALFYSGALAAIPLMLAGLGIAALAVLNRAGVARLWPYLVVGALVWLCVLQSGLHATLAGVVTALFVPLRARDRHGNDARPAHTLEHALKPWVNYAILPVFGFLNAGVAFGGVARVLSDSVTWGIAAGLVIGKQAGIFGTLMLAFETGIASRPRGVTAAHLYGLSLLAGIGFTMSLFIGDLAFAPGTHDAAIRIGVLGGSLVSALAGFFVLRCTAKNR